MNEERHFAIETDEDSYYVSITDMMIGLLFLFILMLMYFALQLRTTTEQLVTADETRNNLLRLVATYLSDHGVASDIDFRAGVLRLPDQTLFDKGRDTPKPEGEHALKVLGDALKTYLPCYTFANTPPPNISCTREEHNLEAIFIEGHTDNDPLTPSPRIRDNWDLSAARAANTFRMLAEFQPVLLTFLSQPPNDPGAQPIFSIAGYSDQRPVAMGNSEETKRQNRRIDIRFVMSSPQAS